MTKRKAEQNKGYSLVEMIIVIAIIVLVSSLSLVSVTLIHSARAKDAAIKFDNEVATLIAKAKSQTPPATNPADPTTMGEYALKVYKSGERYFVAQGILRASGTFEADPDNVVSLSSYVTIRYTGTNSEGEDFNNDEIEDGDRAVIIRYNKRGICLDGVGTYSFYKKNGNLVANDFLRKNGSHESK